MKKHGNCPGFKKGQNCSTGISKGIERWNCILTEEQVLEIRANKNKLSQRKLASMYNVTRGTIQSAIDRKSWKHI
jgi:DNA-binding transcriptional regulator YiaG